MESSDNIFKQLVKYFFSGLIYTVPIAIIIYVGYKLFSAISDFLHMLGLNVHPLIDPLVGIFIFLALIISVGVLGSSIIFKPLFTWVDMKLEKTPVVKTLYTSVKDVMNAFMGSKKKFDKPVLVRLEENDISERIGFITQQDLTHMGLGQERVAVYLPFSYAISGILYIVPRDRVKPLDMPPADVMKFLVSGGVTDISVEQN